MNRIVIKGIVGALLLGVLAVVGWNYLDKKGAFRVHMAQQIANQQKLMKESEDRFAAIVGDSKTQIEELRRSAARVQTPEQAASSPLADHPRIPAHHAAASRRPAQKPRTGRGAAARSAASFEGRDPGPTSSRSFTTSPRSARSATYYEPSRPTGQGSRADEAAHASEAPARRSRARRQEGRHAPGSFEAGGESLQPGPGR